MHLDLKLRTTLTAVDDRGRILWAARIISVNDQVLQNYVYKTESTNTSAYLNKRKMGFVQFLAHPLSTELAMQNTLYPIQVH